MRFVMMQTKLMLQRIETVFCFGLTMFFVLVYYIQNVIQYAGTEIVFMKNPFMMRFLIDNNRYGYFFVALLPFLIVLPGGFTYLNDCRSGEKIFWISRVGSKKYYAGKLAAGFMTSFLAFGVPFFVELLLVQIAFPMKASGNPYGIIKYSSSYAEEYVGDFFLSELYTANPYVYGVLITLLPVLTCAVITAFSVALSMLDIFKFRVLLLLPAYIILSGTYYPNKIFHLEYETNYYWYFYFYDSSHLSEAFWFAFLGVLAAVSLLIVWRRGGRDEVKA